MKKFLVFLLSFSLGFSAISYTISSNQKEAFAKGVAFVEYKSNSSALDGIMESLPQEDKVDFMYGSTVVMLEYKIRMGENIKSWRDFLYDLRFHSACTFNPTTTNLTILLGQIENGVSSHLILSNLGEIIRKYEK